MNLASMNNGDNGGHMSVITVQLTERDKELRRLAKEHSRLNLKTVDTILMQWALRHWDDIPALMSPLEKIEARER